MKISQYLLGGPLRNRHLQLRSESLGYKVRMIGFSGLGVPRLRFFLGSGFEFMLRDSQL